MGLEVVVWDGGEVSGEERCSRIYRRWCWREFETIVFFSGVVRLEFYDEGVRLTMVLG